MACKECSYVRRHRVYEHTNDSQTSADDHNATDRQLLIEGRKLFYLSSIITIFAAVMNHFFRRIFEAIKRWLAGLSFRTGVIILASCVVFYILSFAQMLLPISPAAKGVLWFILFGMAKTTQYMGLAIVGVEGWRRIKGYFKGSKGDKRG